jgi:hypothetical protein
VTHFYYMKMEPGETVGDFLKQFGKVPQDAVINWENIGGLFSNLEKDDDGRFILCLPLRYAAST